MEVGSAQLDKTALVAAAVQRHTTSKARFALAGSLVTLGLLAFFVTAHPQQAAAACNGGQISLGGKPFVFHKSGISCKKAAGLARLTYRTNDAPPGWRCPDASPGNNHRDGANCSKIGNPNKSYGYHAFD